MTTATVIIPTFRKPSYLALTLASFVAQSGDYEIVVADDGSGDNTAEILERFSRVLPLRWTTLNHGGRAAARNRAVAQSSGKYLIFCDDDMVVPTGYVNRMIQGCESAGYNAVLMGPQRSLLTHWRRSLPLKIDQLLEVISNVPELPRLIAGGSTQLVDPDAFPEQKSEILSRLSTYSSWWQRFGAELLTTYGEALTSCNIAWMFGATSNLAISRESWNEIGGFDDTFRRWGLEDTELCFRLHRAGASFRILADALSYHQVHEVEEDRPWAWWDNMLYFQRKARATEVVLYQSFMEKRFGLTELNALAGAARSGAKDPWGQALEELCWEAAVERATIKSLYPELTLTRSSAHRTVTPNYGQMAPQKEAR